MLALTYASVVESAFTLSITKQLRIIVRYHHHYMLDGDDDSTDIVTMMAVGGWIDVGV